MWVVALESGYQVTSLASPDLAVAKVVEVEAEDDCAREGK